MGAIFLSYARDDLATAKRIAGALEAAGHSVWWDQHIGPGSRFSREIDAALRASDLVVVLWSRASIDSTWVQDEAAFGRDHGRLLPLAIEDVEPPLGFRQFQAMRVARSARNSDAVVAALATRLGQPAAVAGARAKLGRALPAWWRLAAIVVIALAFAAGLFLLLRGGGTAHNIVAVAPVDGTDRRSQELARTITADLGRFRAGPLGALSLLGGERRGARNAQYRVEAGVSQAGPNLRADVTLLSGQDSKMLWTTSEQGPAASFVDLRQRAVAKLGQVLGCAVNVSSAGHRLKPDLLSLYLNGCALMSDHIFFAPNQEIISIFRQVTQRAPDFAPGWAGLAMIESQSFPGTPAPERAALRKDLIAHLDKAKTLGPDLPETIAATAYFHPRDGTQVQHALRVLDRGVERHPDSALLHHMRALFLADVGRQNESITAAERALGLNPLSPGIRDSYISAIAYSGRAAAAYDALKEAEAIWPGSAVLEQVRYRLDLRYGDPRTALRALRQRGSGDLRPVPMDTAWVAFLEARIEPSAAKVERMLEGFRARYRRNQADVPAYLQALGTFGRVDEAYEVLKPPLTLDSMLANTEILFRQHMRLIRADPRFIALTAKLGLLAYWEKTGVWPDFCNEPQLPYDCREEAGKLTREQRRLAALG